jgi:phosphoribosylaminoimidazole carboxylase (NCAIR synthetase)
MVQNHLNTRSGTAAVRRIGILGGGQLLQAGFDDEDAARRLADEVDVATFDFENVPDSTARALEARCPLFPASNALGAC